MTRFAIRSSLALALLAPVVLTGCGDAGPAAAGGGGKVSPSDLTVVTVVSPTREAFDRTTTQPAMVHAYQSADVHAKVSGYLKTLAVDIGDEVAAKAELATLWVPEMSKQKERQAQLVLQREADERRAKARVDLAKADVVAARAALAEAESQLDKFVAQLAADESEFVRTTELVNKGSVANRLLDEARNRRDSAKAAGKAAEAAVDTAVANVTVAEAKEAAAVADAEASAAETEVERKRGEEYDELIKYAKLTGPPFAGIVTARNVDPGDLVRNAQTNDGTRAPLFTVEDLSKVRIRVHVPEADAPWIDADVRRIDPETGEESVVEKGDAVTLRFKALGGEPLTGTVTRHTHRLDDETRTLGVEVVLDNPDGRLLPGMYGEATIALDQQPDALVLPATAVRYDESGRSYVYVLDAGDTVTEVDVTTGLDDGSRIEITGGIDESARVVDSTIGRLQDGDKVRVQ